MAISHRVHYTELMKAAVALQLAIFEQIGDMSSQLSDHQCEENILTCAKACNSLAKQYVKQEREG